MHSARLLLTPLALVTLVTAGCGERLRYADRIDVPLSVPGVRALDSLEAQLSEALLEELNGRVPETWPDSLPHVAADLEIPLSILVRRGDLGDVGQDLADAFAGDAEIRVRDIPFVLDQGNLTHPVIGGDVLVGPANALAEGGLGVKPVGRLAGLGEGQGVVVFAPGGRHALEKQLIEEELILVVVLTMGFDTRTDRSRPQGEGRLELGLNVDVLK